MPDVQRKKSYQFLTDQVAYETVETKSGKKFYVTGYISVPEVDLYNDLVTPAALKSMLNQINQTTIMLDYEHEAWRDNNTIIPVGKITDAKIDDRGLWVKAEMNPASPKFLNMWDSIKGGFIKAFSIAFKPLKTVQKSINGTQVRLIEDLALLNVALTGTPVCQGASVTDFGMKSIMLKAIDEFEEEEEEMEFKGKEASTMKTEKKASPDSKEEKEEEVEKKKLEAETAEEEAKEKKEEKADKGEMEEDEKKKKIGVEEKAISDIKIALKAVQDENAELKKQVADLKNHSVFKSVVSEPAPEMKAEPKLMPLSMIR